MIYTPDVVSALDYPEIFIARAKSLAHMAGRALRDTVDGDGIGSEGPTVVTARVARCGSK